MVGEKKVEEKEGNIPLEEGGRDTRKIFIPQRRINQRVPDTFVQVAGAAEEIVTLCEQFHTVNAAVS